MDHPVDAATGLNAITSRDDLTNTVRVDVLGNLDQASRPALVHIIHDLRTQGIQSPIRVDLSRAARVESTALAGLREDLNTTDGAPGAAGGGVSLVLTGERDPQQPEDSPPAGPTGMTDGFDAEFAATFEAGSRSVNAPSFVALPAKPLEEYSDDELFAASDAVFSLLDDPATVGGPDLLGQYNDIGQEIFRRTPLSGLVNPEAERQAAS
jgi:hypothetical protein